MKVSKLSRVAAGSPPSSRRTAVELSDFLGGRDHWSHENVCAGSTVSCFQHPHPGVGLSLGALFVRGWGLGSHIVIKIRQKQFINQLDH